MNSTSVRAVTALVLLALAGLVIAVGQMPAHASPALIVGDANCNGTVDSVDAAIILQFGAGLVPSLSCSQNADVNGDGSVNALDAALVLQYVAGFLPSLGGPPPPTPTLLTRQDLVDYAHYLYCSYHYGGSGPWTVPICQPGTTDCAAECSCIVNDMLFNFTLEQITRQGMAVTAELLAADVQWCLTHWLPAPLPTPPGPGCDPIVGCGPGCDPIVGCLAVAPDALR